METKRELFHRFPTGTLMDVLATGNSCSGQAEAAKLPSLPKVTGVDARCSGKCAADMRGGKLLADPGPASILMCFFIFF